LEPSKYKGEVKVPVLDTIVCEKYDIDSDAGWFV